MFRFAPSFHETSPRAEAAPFMDGPPAAGWGQLPGPHRAVALGAFTFLALLAATAWAWRMASEDATRVAHERFSFKVSEARFAIDQRLQAYEQVLLGGVGLFAASETVTREEWRAYVRTLRIDQTYPGIQGIGFARRMPPAERESHQRSVRAEGFPQYRMWPAGERAEYTSIIYLEPFDWRNQRAFGYDMFSEPVRREAMERARDTGRPAASGQVVLVQETKTDVQTGFLMYLPVYRNGAPVATVGQRRAALLGYVYAPFRMNDLMRGILGAREHARLDLDIHDGDPRSASTLLYDSNPEHLERRDASALTDTSTIKFGGRLWTLRASSLPAFDAAIEGQKPRLILVSGLLISALFAAVVWALSLNRHRARELAAANGGLQQEIAERTKLEDALQRAKDAAEAANEAKSEFLANVSHELRTPLTLILAPVDQLLAAVEAPPAWRHQLERVQRNALLLLNRVNDILDFSKVGAGRLEPRWETLDPAELIAGLVGDALPVAEGKGCTLSWHVDPALDGVCVDRRHFEKILLNLLSNALKFTPPGGRIRVAAVALDDAHFELAVEDSGIGIAADKLPLLFTRFQQVDSSATRQAGGTGIGLALVKELTALMGGCVGVDSEPGRGSRFFVRLPRGADRTAAAGGPERDAREVLLRHVRFLESGQDSAAGTDAALSPHRDPLPQALVADDNPDMRGYVAELLRDDCAVLVAADGEQAWAMLRRHRVDVVICDVMMPELDGLGLAARIKADAALSHVPVILLTARGGMEASVSGLESGADDYLAKPFSPPELKARVRAALRMGQVQTQLREKSREAGMASVIAGILHNLGNVLNGVTVSSAMVRDQIEHSKIPSLRHLAQLLQSHAHELPDFVRHDPRGKLLPEFVGELCRNLEAERSTLLEETETLRVCVDHAVGILATQRQFASPGQAPRALERADILMDAALKLGTSAFDMQDIAIERDYRCTDALPVDRHLVLQILLNLLSNACRALHDAPRGDRRLTLRTVRAGEHLHLDVCDNGVGIAPAQHPRLFSQGFTTHAGPGHGFGLHSSANWARELGGTLRCASAGAGRGARFTLELPLPCAGGDAAAIAPSRASEAG